MNTLSTVCDRCGVTVQTSNSLAGEAPAEPKFWGTWNIELFPPVPSLTHYDYADAHHRDLRVHVDLCPECHRAMALLFQNGMNPQ
jgi:hypothetical protein